MTTKSKWRPWISGALLAFAFAQTALHAADAQDGVRDYLQKEMRELGIPGMQMAIIQHQKVKRKKKLMNF